MNMQNCLKICEDETCILIDEIRLNNVLIDSINDYGSPEAIEAQKTHRRLVGSCALYAATYSTVEFEDIIGNL
jgi:hypothetical protein